MTEGWINYARKYVDKREVTEPNRLPILEKRRQRAGQALSLQDLFQGLIDNEAAIRDRALDALPAYLAGYSEAPSEGGEGAGAGTGGSNNAKKDVKQEDPLAKLWLGLIMCYWHTDRPLTQLDVANRIAGLVHQLPTPSSKVQWIARFFAAIADSWSKIDTHRIDKYLSLIRRVLCDAFRVLKELPAEADEEELAEEPQKATAAPQKEAKEEQAKEEGKGKKRAKLERRLQREREEQEARDRELRRLRSPRQQFWRAMAGALAIEMVSIPMHLADIWQEEAVEAGLPSDLYTRSLQLWLEVLREAGPLATHTLLRVFSMRSLRMPNAPIDREDLLRRVRAFVDPQVKTKQQLAYLQILHNLDELDEEGKKAILKWHPSHLKEERQLRHERVKRLRREQLKKPRKSEEERDAEKLLEKKRGARRGHRTKGVGPSRVKRLPDRGVIRNTVVDLI